MYLGSTSKEGDKNIKYLTKSILLFEIQLPRKIVKMNFAKMGKVYKASTSYEKPKLTKNISQLDLVYMIET